MSEKMNIWWIRRDLRLRDSPALQAAMADSSGVLPVFILDEKILNNSPEKRTAFLLNGLKTLKKELEELGSGLIVRRGEPVEVLSQIVQESGADKIFAVTDVTPYAKKRDFDAAQRVDLRLVSGLGVFPTGMVRRPDGNPYTVFTPYSHAWKALPLSSPAGSLPRQLPAIPQIGSEAIPEIPALIPFISGEREAQKRLSAFLEENALDYDQKRNRMDLNGTSILSPYLRFGMLSPRAAAAEARQMIQTSSTNPQKNGYETWINELIWRDFYLSILDGFPHVLKGAFHPIYDNISWRESSGDLNAWKSGETGYPIVDAGMRQLAATGWMHNRARMITASFLVKHLLIHWKEGEKWFMQNLIDGDPASNNGGWQWTAGTGTDAAPYFRIFNPILQSQKFDPQGTYIRRWVPELAEVPQDFIHSPWKMNLEQQRLFGVKIGGSYPNPIVDHAFARQRVLAAYSSVKKTAVAKNE